MSLQQSFQHIQQAGKRRRILLVLGIVGAFLIAIAALGYTFLSAAPPAQVVKVGQTLTISNMDVTLTGVGQLTYNAVIYAPEDIVVHVELTNHGGSEQAYSPLDFHVKSGAGSITDLEAVPPDTYQSGNLLQPGSLTPGGTVQGDIVFRVTAEDHQAELLWRPNGSSGDNGWNLGL